MQLSRLSTIEWWDAGTYGDASGRMWRPHRPAGVRAVAGSRFASEESRLGSVRCAQALEHRKVLDVAGREIGVYRFCGSGNRKVGDADVGVAASPSAAELSSATSHGLGHGYPRDQREKPVGGSSLRGSQPLDHLYSADLRARRTDIEAGEVLGGWSRGTQVIHQDAGVEDDAQPANRERRLASARRTSSTYSTPSSR